jgi:hypothetical protein
LGDEWDEENYDPSPIPSLKFKELFHTIIVGGGREFWD